MTEAGASASPHRAVRIEARAHAVLERRLERKGWVPVVVPFTGYGRDGWVRVLARVHVVPPGSAAAVRIDDARGWRQFVVPSLAGVPVTIEVGGQTHRVVSMRKGYVDVRLDAELETGWTSARLAVGEGPPVEAPLRIVGPDTKLGVICDVDDTVIVTDLPKPLVALRNALLIRGAEREPVSGMVELFQQIEAANPGILVVYLSTGSWQTAPALADFLNRHGYPRGPMLLSHWGPTPEGWFRSGVRHKREQLFRLFEELPQVRWLLVGDDTQHDPALYAEAAETAPAKVLGIAIRQLSAVHDSVGQAAVDRPVYASDGFGLRDGLAGRGLILPREAASDGDE